VLGLVCDGLRSLLDPVETIAPYYCADLCGAPAAKLFAGLALANGSEREWDKIA
jgi:hypothetical protein